MCEPLNINIDAAEIFLGGKVKGQETMVEGATPLCLSYKQHKLEKYIAPQKRGNST